MTPTIALNRAKNILAAVWFSLTGILFLILFTQTLFGVFDNKANEAWGWFLPFIVPTLSLIIAVFVMDARATTTDKKPINRFFFILATCLSVLYLFTMGIVLIASQLIPSSSLDILKNANLGLSPMQGLVTAAIGIFFFNAKASDNIKSDDIQTPSKSND